MEKEELKSGAQRDKIDLGGVGGVMTIRILVWNFPPKRQTHYSKKSEPETEKTCMQKSIKLFISKNYRELSESNTKKTMNQMKCALKV